MSFGNTVKDNILFKIVLVIMMSLCMVGALSEPAFCQVEEKIYWTDPDTSNIQRSDLDGSNVEDLIIGFKSPFSLAIDTEHGKMYWSDSVAKKIQRANLDGTNVEDIVSGLKDPFGTALDLVNSKIYWVEAGEEESTITRCSSFFA